MLGNGRHIERAGMHTAESFQLNQRAEKLAGTPRHMLRQPGEHIAADGKLAPLGPVLKKRQPAGSTKRLQSNDQTARQPAHKARWQVREPCGPDVRREDHLPPAGQEIVNRLHERLNDRAIDNRDRSIRLLSHHIFRIGEAFLETAIDGVEYWVQLANVPPEDGSYTTGEEIAAYGNSMIERIENWWSQLDDKSCQQKVKTFYGTPPMHQLLERSTWHSAQHTRQMIAVLERFGIEPDVRLTAEDLAGLPLPEGIWE